MRRRALSETGSKLFNLANNFTDTIIKKIVGLIFP